LINGRRTCIIRKEGKRICLDYFCVCINMKVKNPALSLSLSDCIIEQKINPLCTKEGDYSPSELIISPVDYNNIYAYCTLNMNMLTFALQFVYYPMRVEMRLVCHLVPTWTIKQLLK